MADNSLILASALVVTVVGLWLQPRLAATAFIGSRELKDALQIGIDALIRMVFWAPVSGFVLEWVPFARTRRGYQAILTTELTVRPEMGSG